MGGWRDPYDIKTINKYRAMRGTKGGTGALPPPVSRYGDDPLISKRDKVRPRVTRGVPRVEVTRGVGG